MISSVYDVEAKGVDLAITAMNLNFLRLIQPQQDVQMYHQLPSTIHDLFPTDFAAVRRQKLANLFQGGKSCLLPSAFLHPLRNVEMQRLDGTLIRVDIKIRISNPKESFGQNLTIFQAIIKEHTEYSSW